MTVRKLNLPIRVLPPEVSARIAAGEVVERPASVVKELLENALDAGAGEVAVEIEGGGLKSVRLVDNGCGIHPEEMEIAFSRHATSKLASDDDLSTIQSLGFRGEALPSIASVADVEIVSRPAPYSTATYLRLVGGAVVDRGSQGAPVGSSIRVTGLFASQPARLKFLRSPRREGQLISSVVSSYALAYPEVRFSLRLDGRQLLLTPGDGDNRDALACVYDAEVAGMMLPVAGKEGVIAVDGLVSPPQLSRASRNYISIFVNRRRVRSRRLNFAVEDAYQGMLMVGRHPIAVIDIRLPTEEVDVNVHPTKAEVRFKSESAVFAAIQKVVRPALVQDAPVPIVSGRGTADTASLSLAFPSQSPIPPLLEYTRRLKSTHSNVPQGVSPGVMPARLALPALRVIGQLSSTYVIAEGQDGVYLIDQHAAHERVLFDRLSAKRQDAQPEVQGLLEPVLVDPSPRQEAVLSRHDSELALYGFAVEPFGGGSYLIRSVPALIADSDIRGSFLELLDFLLEEDVAIIPDRIAMSLACHGAIRAGKKLAMEEMRELILQLERSEVPNTCPHGRPTMIYLSVDLLAREFGRR